MLTYVLFLYLPRSCVENQCTDMAEYFGEDIKPDLKNLELFAPVKEEPSSEQSHIKNASNTNKEDKAVESEDVKDLKPFFFNDVLKREPKSTDEEECSPGQPQSQNSYVGSLPSQDQLSHPESFAESNMEDDIDPNVDYHELLRRAMEEENVTCVSGTKKSKKKTKDYASTSIQENVGEYSFNWNFNRINVLRNC